MFVFSSIWHFLGRSLVLVMFSAVVAGSSSCEQTSPDALSQAEAVSKTESAQETQSADQAPSPEVSTVLTDTLSDTLSDSSNALPDPDSPSVVPVTKSAPTYSFDKPNASFKLAGDLKEISGLSYLDAQHLIAVQDEKGKIFKLRISDGKIVDDYRFAKDGDYEGIELVDDEVYVLRSDGDLYRVRDWDRKKSDSKKFETDLSERYDTEGLSYDAANNRLLIACKEYAGKGRKGMRAVFAFDLDSKELSKEPALILNIKEITSSISDNKLNKALRNLVAPISDLSGFKPSAIAIHPVTKETYVISSVLKLLVVYDSQGQHLRTWQLPPKLMAQPEGLAFLPNGDLFISSEGAGNKATLTRFNYK